jgi:tetratricopeptide (TPR) repeat protein
MEARAAAIEGDHSRSAALLAQLVESSSANQTITKQAVAQAISAGDMKLALRLARGLPGEATPIEARFLQVADALRSNDNRRALSLLQDTSEAGSLGFLRPFVEAWVAADAKDMNRSLAALNAVSPRDLLGGIAPEHRALILLKFGKTSDAEPFVEQALNIAGGREQRMRLVFADRYLAAKDRARALAVIADGLGTESAKARDRVLQGRLGDIAISNSREAFSELMVALAVELNRMRNPTMPIALAQVARYAAPNNSSASVILGVLLASRDRTAEAVAALRSVPSDDLLSAQARDAEMRALVGAERKQEALAVAYRAANAPGADISDFARLGDVLEALDRHADAAAAYGRAVQLAQQGRAEDRWPLLLLQAAAYEEGDHWPEARQALLQALALAPDQPLILNFLGYAKLERGEDLDAAEAMIRKASALAPDDSSITDSLGWAVFKRGRTKEAIEILTRAAKGDPAQAEIHEHLGDALYKAGNKYEARYAWSAALVTAEDEVARRLKAKIETGLTPATAAP